jgi:predicted nuclease with TOPRIM domain
VLAGITVLSLAALACQGGTGVQARIPADSTEYFRTQVEQLTMVSAEKDSLLRELTETTRLITDVSNELATIRLERRTVPAGGGEGAIVDERAELLNRVKALTGRVRETEQRLAAAQRRINSLTAASDSLRIALQAYANTIAELQQVVESQKSTIFTLNEQVTTLTGQVSDLASQVATLEDTVAAQAERENEVYYVIGTRRELEQKGIITAEGGTRFLLFTRTGETLVPARVLDPQLFTRADRRTLTEIPLPRSDKDYRIVSRHDLAFAEATSVQGQRIRGTLRITSPLQFWANSKFLIIVEQ